MTRRHGRAGSAGEEPVVLRDALHRLTGDLGGPDSDELTGVVAAWRDVVGTVVAEHAHVRSVHDGVCTVVVDAPAWATQLRYLEAAVLDRAAEVVGPGVVRAVKVVVAPPPEPVREPPVW